MKAVSKIAGFVIAEQMTALSESVVIELLAKYETLEEAFAAAPYRNWEMMIEAQPLIEAYYRSLREASGYSGAITAKFEVSQDLRNLNFGGVKNFSNLDHFSKTVLFRHMRESVQELARNDEASAGAVIFNEVGACTYCRAARLEVLYFAQRDSKYRGFKNLHDGCRCSLTPVFKSNSFDEVATAGEIKALGKVEQIQKSLKVSGYDAVLEFLNPSAGSNS